jgi:cytoskeletal protein RodZ
MPLDTGGATDLQLAADQGRGFQPPETNGPTIHSGGDIGQALKAIREFKGLSLESVAETTRVRRAYLADIEAMRLEKLPSRPFTIGYIRAYAAALGLDAEGAVNRFKAEEPALDESLHEPLGVGHDRDPRIMAIVIVAVMIVVAIVVWNIAQRAMNDSAPPSATAPAEAAAAALATDHSGAVSLGAPLPAPVESTTPPAYETPGLAEADENGVNHSKPKPIGAKADGEPGVNPATLPQVFEAEGAIYGASAQQPSSVILKARTSTSLIVRGPDGSAYFARQLAAGEAYRAPELPGLTAEASEPDNVQVFVGGRSKGVLPASHVALGALAGE